MTTAAELKQANKTLADASREINQIISTATRYRRALTEIAALADEGSNVKRIADAALRELTNTKE